MKSFRKELIIKTDDRREYINITRDVQEAIRESEIKEGFVLVNAMHITASVFINDDESALPMTLKFGLKNWLLKSRTICIDIMVTKTMPMLILKDR